MVQIDSGTPQEISTPPVKPLGFKKKPVPLRRVPGVGSGVRSQDCKRFQAGSVQIAEQSRLQADVRLGSGKRSCITCRNFGLRRVNCTMRLVTEPPRNLQVNTRLASRRSQIRDRSRNRGEPACVLLGRLHGFESRDFAARSPRSEAHSRDAFPCDRIHQTCRSPTAGHPSVSRQTIVFPGRRSKAGKQMAEKGSTLFRDPAPGVTLEPGPAESDQVRPYRRYQRRDGRSAETPRYNPRARGGTGYRCARGLRGYRSPARSWGQFVPDRGEDSSSGCDDAVVSPDDALFGPREMPLFSRPPGTARLFNLRAGLVASGAARQIVTRIDEQRAMRESASVTALLSGPPERSR